MPNAIPPSVRAIKSGRTFQSIGQEYGLSREAVRQIAGRIGITSTRSLAARKLSVSAIQQIIATQEPRP
jgi:DNA-directed RNA polymerase sigma subunit (sigma70/sigma32)